MHIKHKIKRFLVHHGFCKRPKISLLIPFSTEDKARHKNFKWLLRYWKYELPDAEIIVGKSRSRIFCKGEALNDAFEKSTGKVLVVLDADAYLPGKIITHCADRILEEQKYGNNLWFVPYRLLYRLTRQITEMIVHSDPKNPLRLPIPPPDCYIENHGDIIHYGHMFGAMITIFPRKALDYIRCFDEHFVGWGGEDVSFLRMMDTLFGKHKTTNNPVFHLWHPYHGKTHRERTWDNQDTPNKYWRRTSQYRDAIGNIPKMGKLAQENWDYYFRRK